MSPSVLDTESGNPASCVVQDQEVVVGRGTKRPQAEEHEARPGRKQKRKRSERPEIVRKKDQVWSPFSTSELFFEVNPPLFGMECTVQLLESACLADFSAHQTKSHSQGMTKARQSRPKSVSVYGS